MDATTPPASVERPPGGEPEPAPDQLLQVIDLKVSFRSDEGLVRAVDGVTFDLAQGLTLGLVGESGSGKSVTTKAVMQLLPNNAVVDPASRLYFRTERTAADIATLAPRSREMRRIRGGEIAMIFQEPMASFSPVYTIGNQMMEAIRLHRHVGKAEAREIAVDMLDRVGIANPALRVRQYPHELSGGMRQRAMIALALSTRPALLIADEPTTALDVTTQAQVLELLDELRRDFAMAMIFITHDMGVIAQVAQAVAVMYLGRVVERGPTRALIDTPHHPYTEGLLRAIPRLDRLDERLSPVGGDIPSPMERPTGCPFHPRCARMIAGTCDTAPPPSVKVGPDHHVDCFLYA